MPLGYRGLRIKEMAGHIMYVRFALILLIAIATSTRLAVSQHMRAEPSNEHVGTPSSQPLPQKQITAGPITLMEALLSEDRERRYVALRQLGVTTNEDSVALSDARVEFINLAQCSNCEAVLSFTDAARSTSAFVMYKSDDEWWQIGEFHYSWHWNSQQAEHLIELREIVWPGTKDVIVRTMSGGTGVVLTELSIYRVYEAKLYKVFDTVEEKEYSALGVPGVLSFYERASISFKTEDDAEVPSIVVDRRKTAIGAINRADRERPLSCEGYAWSASTFSFTRDQKVTAQFCHSGVTDSRSRKTLRSPVR